MIISNCCNCLQTAMTFLSEVDRLGYPPPAPPTTKKSDIFHIEKYTSLDSRATKVGYSCSVGCGSMSSVLAAAAAALAFLFSMS